MLYETIALRPPFKASDMQGLYDKVIKGNYPRIPKKFSADLGMVIKGLLQVKGKSLMLDKNTLLLVPRVS